MKALNLPPTTKAEHLRRAIALVLDAGIITHTGDDLDKIVERLARVAESTATLSEANWKAEARQQSRDEFKAARRSGDLAALLKRISSFVYNVQVPLTWGKSDPDLRAESRAIELEIQKLI